MRRLATSVFSLSSMALAILALPVQAQNTTTDAPAEAVLPQVIVQEKAQEDGYQPKSATTATRTDAPLRDVPQAIAVVPAQVLQDQMVRSIDDALFNVSGITQANTLGGTQDAVIKRGFGFNRDGSILRDGIRTVLARNLTFTTERVEVLKGPSSVLYGTMDPGGVINMVTKKPQLSFAGQVGASVSSYGGGGASMDLTGPLGDNGLAYRLIADTSHVDYWRNFGKNKQTVIAPSLAWYGRDTYVRVSYEHTEYEQPFDRGTVIDSRTGKPVNTNRRERFDEAYNRTIGDSDFFTVQAQHALNPQWKLNTAYSYNRNRYDDYQARPVSLNPTTGVLTRRPDGTRGALSQQHVAQFNLQGNVQTGSIRHDILAGFDAEDSNIYRRDLIRGSNAGGFNVHDPVYGLMPNSTNVDAAQSDQRDKIRQQALFAQDSMRLSEQWIVQLAGRWQRYDQIAGKGRPFVVGSESDGTQFVPRAGLVWQPGKHWSIYGSYSESFKPQSSIGNVIGTLPPETAKAWELGTKWETPAGITATAALYDIKKRNVVVTETIAGQNYARAVGGARSRGLELDAAGRLGKQWQLIGTYAYTDASVTDDPQYQGNRLANVARHTASLFAAYDLPASSAGRWRTGAGLRHVGKRAGDAANTFENSGYSVADAFVSWERPWSGRMVKLQLNVKNLFDKNYVSSSGSPIYVSLGERRQAVLRAVVDF
ncbi:TonB-dependent siderophore receptor (plasmid) [Diaphorobacter sp. HDW4B]|uniref:TonB-dependent siderophore receptor n=1 Tax=Diaphorobacter sp. HDW4B TaxID=2714925 RepID=UPI0014076A4A|nr:TonB-dependent siderophore receptor [Diaphorobacter sp. HDW4B]QIL73792.1 TonB-dependent siderophore receptor [Diaphorobacter sp. HDW4B]